MQCPTITIIDKETKQKAGQLRYNIKDEEAEIFDTYLFPDYRRKKIMSSLFKKMTSELKVYGVSKVLLNSSDDVARMAWESMGFRQIDEKGHMEFDLDI